MRRWLLGGILVVIALSGPFVFRVLVPGEAERPPPPEIAEPIMDLIPVPFSHRWAIDTSHPLLAAAAIDIDGDGKDEVFLGGSDGQPDSLLIWRNGELADIAAEQQLGDESATYGAVSLDTDSDGDVDLLTTGRAGLTLWLNDGGGKFLPRALDVAIPSDAVPLAVAAGDYDRDGHVDLYLSLFIAPELFRSPVFNDPEHAKGNLLLRNDGTFKFTDVTDSVTTGRQNTFTSSFVDLNGDNWLDLVMAQNTGEVEILRNLSGEAFERVSFLSGFGFWMGLGIGDVDRDGDQDLFFSNLGNSIPGALVKGDRANSQVAANEWMLLRNDGDFSFTDVTDAAGLTGFGFAWGAAFEDVNFDGRQDLLVAENYVKWPIHKVFPLSSKLFLAGHEEEPVFYTSDAVANGGFGHVPLIADLDGDGRNDIVWANMAGPARAFLNRSPGNFVSIRLPDDPGSIGAQLRLEESASPTIAFVAGEGLTSDRTTQFTFGISEQDLPPSAVIIRWADGQETRIAEPPLNEPIMVRRH